MYKKIFIPPVSKMLIISIYSVFSDIFRHSYSFIAASQNVFTLEIYFITTVYHYIWLWCEKHAREENEEWQVTCGGLFG